jgi:deoxyribose-phosphate aldolase
MSPPADAPGITPVISAREVAACIDHTLLRPEATLTDLDVLCAEAAELGVAAVCVSPTMVTRAHAHPGRTFTVCTVVGFPSGAHLSRVKAAEAGEAEAQGATEFDLVIDLGRARAHDWAGVASEVAEVRSAVLGTLKVILESAALTPAELDAAATAAVEGGADYLKTSTGFHPAGGATVQAVAALARVAAAAGRPVGVKAAGGIREARTALDMLSAGATRLGCSSTRAVLDGLADI